MCGRLTWRLEAAHWVLAPGWAKGDKSCLCAGNARSEPVDTQPMFRMAFTERRCALAVNSCCAWERTEFGWPR
ncbi:MULTISPECIES: SOS response-associated peptidase family protein [unclassified Brevibacterium]|nr:MULTISPECIES: SOS response-associated peptidase family protein [unclassified Brevibacterium]